MIGTDKKIILIVSLILNLAILVMEIFAMYKSFSTKGIDSFRMFTQDSNILAGIVSAIYLGFGILLLTGKIDSFPYWVRLIRLMATIGLTVTIIIVVTVLCPPKGIEGYKEQMLGSYLLYLHFLCPVISIVSYIFFEKNSDIAFKHLWIGLIPLFIYGIVLITLNVAKVVKGPYPFLRVYDQPVYISVLWTVGIAVGAYALEILLWKLNNMGS